VVEGYLPGPCGFLTQKFDQAVSLRKAIGDPAGIEWSVAEARHLKGIRGEVLLYGARRLPTGELPGGDESVI
jgi:hypothetical protein